MDDPRLALGDVADVAYNDLAAAVANSGVDAVRAWQGFASAWQEHKTATSRAEFALEQLNSDDAAFMPLAERQVRQKAALDAHAAETARTDRAVRNTLDILDSVMAAAAASDLSRDADSMAVLLVRQEIDARLSMLPRGMTTTQAIYNLARQDSRYARELAAGYGQIKLQQAGEMDAIPSLVANIVKLTPGTTPKAQAARAALATLAKARGSIAGLTHAARARVEVAAAPRPVQGYRPDTLIQRRAT